MTLDELRNLAEAATPGPYYVGHDDAPDCPAHRRSGLSSVDTGRSGDWPIARLCETPSAVLIAALSPSVVLAMIECIRKADVMRDTVIEEGYKAGYIAQETYDTARAKLDEVMK